jgi:3-hydroxyacyl-CoA dehydrogenase
MNGIRVVGVVGAGALGRGVSQSLAQSGVFKMDMPSPVPTLCSRKSLNG